MLNIEELKDYGDDVRNGLENILEEDADQNYFDSEERQVLEKALKIIKNRMKELIAGKPTKKQLLKMPKRYLQSLLEDSYTDYSKKDTKKQLIDNHYDDLSELVQDDYENAYIGDIK